MDSWKLAQRSHATWHRCWVWASRQFDSSMDPSSLELSPDAMSLLMAWGLPILLLLFWDYDRLFIFIIASMIHEKDNRIDLLVWSQKVPIRSAPPLPPPILWIAESSSCALCGGEHTGKSSTPRTDLRPKEKQIYIIWTSSISTPKQWSNMIKTCDATRCVQLATPRMSLLPTASLAKQPSAVLFVGAPTSIYIYI